MSRVGFLVLAAAATCQPVPRSDPQPAPAPPPPVAARPDPPQLENWDRDLIATRLDVDIGTSRATATIELAAANEPGASLEAAGLEIDGVQADGVAVAFEVESGALHVAAPAAATQLIVDYRFHAQEKLEGFKDGLTLTWPYNCGNLFPCDSTPADGVTFELSVHVPAGQTAIYPAQLHAEAPSYMLAWVVGPYEQVELGSTASGRRVSLWSQAAHLDEAKSATARLPALFDWLERTYGEYSYGDHVGTIVVDWGPGGLGGMEHHPYWHVSAADAADTSVHVHEAAHGWYGNGVRMACWEDFVLSEGTVTYMATRAIEEVLGAKAGRARWKAHQARLDALQASDRKKIAWPDGCNEIDILEDGLFGPAPYVKGALFYRAVAGRIGVAQLDSILREFYLAHRGHAARFDDMLSAIQAASGYDARSCAIAWLRREGVPGARACLD